MTVTIKLEAPLEERLRQRAASTGSSTSDVVRAALKAYLSQPETVSRSPHDLGEDLFGRYRGTENLSQDRKREAADAWRARHTERGS